MKEIKELKEINKKPNDFRLVLLGIALVVVVSIVLGIIGFIVGNKIQNSISMAPVDLLDISSKCIGAGGTWVGESQECENISEPLCRSFLGDFDACASPCRNIAGEVMCIQSCVQVCAFNK